MTTMCEAPELKLVTSSDVKAVKNFVREFFAESEPMNQYLIRKECKNFRYFERADSIGDLIDEGLSYMFVTKTGQIVAVGLIGTKLDEQHSCKHPTPMFNKIMPFIEMVEKEIEKIVEVTEADKEACFWIMSVHPDWRGKGLAKSLLAKVKSSLKTLGFTHIRAFCTSAYSIKLFKTFGFENLYSFKYSDYTPNGEVVLLPDEPHTHLNFMSIKL